LGISPQNRSRNNRFNEKHSLENAMREYKEVNDVAIRDEGNTHLEGRSPRREPSSPRGPPLRGVS